MYVVRAVGASIEVWDVKNGVLLKHLLGHSEYVRQYHINTLGTASGPVF